MVVNQAVLDTGLPPNPLNPWPPFPAGKPPLLNVRDVLRYATINGAKHLRLDGKTGSLTPGKEADIILLDATHLNVAPINHVPGAVVTMMERSNVETVIVAGKVRKWKGRLLDVDVRRLRRQLEDSRDYRSAPPTCPRTCSADGRAGEVGASGPIAGFGGIAARRSRAIAPRLGSP
jgi:hypothetical protein